MPKSPLEIANMMGAAAHKKAQKSVDPDEDGDVHSSYSEGAKKAISSKMDVMKDENKPQKQKVAIALSEARSKGLKVPPPKGK